MKHKYTPGQDCECSAYSESECGCGADWTPSEVYELREKLAAERALADRLAGYICDIHDVTSSRKVLKITVEACKTWWTHRKEARSE